MLFITCKVKKVNMELSGHHLVPTLDWKECKPLFLQLLSCCYIYLVKEGLQEKISLEDDGLNKVTSFLS